MSYSYKDLTYIRAALQTYEATLLNIKDEECEGDEYSEVQDDIQYIARLLALTEREIDGWEKREPSLTTVK